MPQTRCPKYIRRLTAGNRYNYSFGALAAATGEERKMAGVE